MSSCFRTVPNKFMSFVNTRKQVTKIDGQLPKHIKSSSLLEEFCSNRVAPATINFKERPLNPCAVYPLAQNFRSIYVDTFSELPEVLTKKSKWNEEQIEWMWQQRLTKNWQLGTVNPDTTRGLLINQIVANNNVQWVNPVMACNDLSKNSENKSVIYDNKELPINRILHSTPIPSSIERERSVRAEPTSNVHKTDENQPSPNPSGRPTEAHLQEIYNILSRDLAQLFGRPMDYRIYTQDVIFVNNIRGFTTKGIFKYVKQMALLKTVGHLKFAYVKFDILKITMHTEDDSIKVRWRIRGITGMKVILNFWKFKLWRIQEALDNGESWYDGFSTFYVNGEGKVFKHIADKMMPDPDVCKKKTPIAAKLAFFAALIGLDTCSWHKLCFTLSSHMQLPQIK